MSKLFSSIALFFIFTFTNCFSQNKYIADSCWRLYVDERTVGDSLRLSLLAKVSFNQTNPDSIVFYSELLINEAFAKANNLFLAKGYYYKGIGLRGLSRFEEALASQIRSHEHAMLCNNDIFLACIDIETANIYSAIGNHIYAINYYKRSIFNLRELNDNKIIASAYYNLGGEYIPCSKLDSALYYFRLSEKAYKLSYDMNGTAYAKGSIGIIYAKMNYLDSAQLLILSAVQTLKAEKQCQSIVSYVLWLAIIKQKLGDLNNALEYANNALEIANEYGLKDKIRDSYDQLANVYAAMGRYKEANEALKNYYAYRDSIVNTETITKIANLRTDFEVGQKQAELDVVRAQDSFKTKVAWFLAVVLLAVVVFLYIIYRHFRYGQRLAVLLKRQNHERQQQKIALEAAVAAKDRLFSVVAHDLRGPIGAMGNLVILANDAMANSEWGDLQSILIMMGDSNREVENLLNSLLYWSIGQRGTYTTKVESVDFTRLVQSVIDVYLPIAFAKGVHISFVPQYEEHLIETDLNSWAVIVRNLVNNAVKFTHLGGVVTVSAQQHPDYLALKVSDTGIGMDPEFAQNVFAASVNQSQWGTASEKGLGIGLSLVKDFVSMNGGQISVESQVGLGTTFTVTMPVKVLKASSFITELM